MAERTGQRIMFPSKHLAKPTKRPFTVKTFCITAGPSNQMKFCLRREQLLIKSNNRKPLSLFPINISLLLLLLLHLDAIYSGHCTQQLPGIQVSITRLHCEPLPCDLKTPMDKTGSLHEKTPLQRRKHD